MAELSSGKGSPSIDMTPMVDLAFLLVTFFMLAATFRTDEPVDVSIPSSIGDKEIPEKTLVQVTVDKGGRIYFTLTGEEPRKNVLLAMASKYKIKLNQEMIDQFVKISSIGCTVQDLPQYLMMDGNGRKAFRQDDPAFVGIPADSTNNQLADWINYANKEMNEYGKKRFEDESSKLAPGKPALDPKEFKPKFVLKAAMDAEYVRVKQAIEVFRDLNLNNLNFITSQEALPTTK